MPSFRPFPARAMVLALLLALAACAPATTDSYPTWSAAAAPRQLAVEPADFRLTLHFATDQAALPAAERERLVAFLAAVAPTSQDSISLEGHADERAGEPYNLELAAQRAAAVRRALSDYGVPEAIMRSHAFGERLPRNPASEPAAWRQNRRVELRLQRPLVRLPACGDWRPGGDPSANRPLANFGCASAANLGLMVAEPRDLIRGRGLAPADGVHQAEGIRRYHEHRITPLDQEGTQ